MSFLRNMKDYSSVLSAVTSKSGCKVTTFSLTMQAFRCFIAVSVDFFCLILRFDVPLHVHIDKLENMKNHHFTSMLLLGLLTAAPVSAQQYKVAKVERTRILMDKRWDNAPDSAAAAFIAPYKVKVDSVMGPVVGTAAHYMARHRPESELSNLLCDILVWAGKKFGESPDFSVYNMGGIRSGLPQGKITVGDINDMAPFENKICFLTLSGEKVQELFRQIAHRGGEGLSHAVKLVITKDGHLSQATVNGVPVDSSKSYRIATLDYLAEGNDQLVAFKSGTDVLAPKKAENNVRYIIMDYFREKMAKGESVESRVEGRCVVE